MGALAGQVAGSPRRGTTRRRRPRSSGSGGWFRGPAAVAPTARDVWSADSARVESEGDDPLLGRRVGGCYDLVRLLGVGGMGRAYLATEVAAGRPVVVKVLRPALAGMPAMAGRFRAEATLASQIDHPHVVSVLDYGEHDALPYLVMEYVDGPTLADLVSVDGPVPLGHAARLMGQLLGALAEVHAAGIVHGDVKSDNVIVQPARAGDRIKLVDFGLARRVDDVAPAGGVAGTPEYLAPELARGQAWRPAADLYAAGVILYELLTGERPFAGPSPLDVIERQLRDDAAPPSSRAPRRAIPAAVDAMVARALAKDPAARFPTAAAMALALAAAVRAGRQR